MMQSTTKVLNLKEFEVSCTNNVKPKTIKENNPEFLKNQYHRKRSDSNVFLWYRSWMS